MTRSNNTGPALAGRLRAARAGALSGETSAPGDKSISHRALIFGALAEGVTTVHGLLEGDDVLRTAGAMRALGAQISRSLTASGPVWRIEGAKWRDPETPLYFGNSGTGCRLVLGALAGQGVTATLEGDASLRSRPMGRIAGPLSEMGARISTRDGKLPAEISLAMLNPIDFTLPVASAQIKSAVLLAALGATGETIVREPIHCRDHTERMLNAFGADIAVSDEAGVRVTRLQGGRLVASDVKVPGDPSSAAFPVAAALITPGSNVTVRGVLINPLRAGVFETWREMGADIVFENERIESGEPVADIRARHSSLKGVAVPASRAASMIDEYPILSVVAAFADGDTYMPGIEELRVKESDRIDATEALLRANGVETSAGGDWLRVTGKGPQVAGGGEVITHGDHRIAMSALVLGCASDRPVTIDDASMIATSFPSFADLMAGLGAEFAPA